MEATAPRPPWYWRLADRVAQLFAHRSPSIGRMEALDAAALRDLGVDRGELESIESESHGAAALARRRMCATGPWMA